MKSTSHTRRLHLSIAEIVRPALKQYWRTHAFILSFLFVFSTMKVFILFFAGIGSERLVADEYTNLDYANSLINYSSYVSQDGLAYRPPVYSLFLVCVKLIAGNKIVYYKIFNILLSTGTLYLVYGSLGARTRIPATVMLALYPPYFFLYELVLAENLAIFWVALLIKIYQLHKETKRITSVILFGSISGLLALTRPESMLYLVLAQLGLAFRDRRMLLSLFTMFVCVQFWLFRNYSVFGRYPLFSTNSANTFYLATFPESTGTSIYSNDDMQLYPTFSKDLQQMRGMNELQSYDFFLRRGWHYLQSNPAVFFRLLPRRVATALAPESTVAARLIEAGRYHLSANSFHLFVALAWLWDTLFWLLLFRAIVFRRIDAFYLTFLVGLIITVCMVIAEARYRMQIMPALVVGAFAASRGHDRYDHRSG